MKLHLEREYWPAGTNGTLTIDDHKIGNFIELPWKRNKPNVSCIPEGIYQLEKRFSEKWGWHVEVTGVPGRSHILIHPANDALKQLQGCLAPVTRFTGEGKGTKSKVAFEKFKESVYAAIDAGEEVLLEIRSYPDAALNLAQYELSWME